MTQQPDPYAQAEQAALQLTRTFGVPRLDVAVVLGSGWAESADAWGQELGRCELAELTGFSAPVVEGHGGQLRVVRSPQDRLVAVFTGRTHYYEGRGVDAVVHAVRTAAAAGATTLVLTNACGSLQPSWGPGTPVLISDQINLTGTSPVSGARFFDMGEAYSPRLRALARSVDPDLAEGVYIQFRGPQYETPAEIKMAAAMGAELVGMSTALETIAAREAGVEVLGISLVTNLAAGISPVPLDHREVIEAGLAAAPRLGALLSGLAGVL